MADDKSEKPTQQRMRKAREEGQFLASRGMLTAVQFVVFVWIIGQLSPALVRALEDNLRRLFQSAFEGELSLQNWSNLLRLTLWNALSPLLILGGCIFGVTLAVHLSITKFGFTLNRLLPQIKNFNPAGRLSGLPAQNLKSLLEALFLMVALGIAIYTYYEDQTSRFLQMPFEALPVSVAEIASSLRSVMWRAAFLFILFGSVDIAFQYKRYMSRLKMTKQEVRDEHKRSEGDPQIKGRIRRMRRELLRRQMMKQVPKATAVIVNPTHFAVAIRYEMETMSSPVVVAKGKNWLALRIRQVALASEVPIIENPPLARALYDAAEVGSAISPEFYKAIAEILAYVYKLMDRKLR